MRRGLHSAILGASEGPRMDHQTSGVALTLLSILFVATIPVFLYKVFHRRRSASDR